MKRALAWMILCSYFWSIGALAGTVTRGTKSSGGTEFAPGTKIKSSEVNTDFNAIYTVVNGGLDNANISDFAAITQGKIVDPKPSEVKGYSASVAEMDDDESPGSYASRTMAATLQQEIEQLRYVVSRLAGLTNAKRTNATGSQVVGWLERPANPYNLIRNASFTSEDVNQVPTPWVLVTAATSLIFGADAAEGLGRTWNISVSSDNRGFSYTLTKLRASTRYVVVVRAAEGSGACDITTTGADATSEWRNLDLDLNGGTFANYIGVIQTDATPTNIVLQLFGDGGACQMNIRHVGVYELRDDTFTGTPHVQGINWKTDSAHTCAAGVTSEVGFNLPTFSPTSGYVVRVHVDGAYASTGPATLELKIMEASIGEITPDLDLQDGAVETARPFSMTRLFHTTAAADSMEFDLQCTASAGSSFTLTDMNMYAEIISLE